MIIHVADLNFDSWTRYSSQTTVLGAVCSSRPQLWIRTTHRKLNLQSRRGAKCWHLEGKVTGSFSEEKNVTWKIIAISVHEIWVGGACTPVTGAEGAWILNGSSHWSFSAVLFHMPTASTLDSRSYLGWGSAELNIKICLHKPEQFPESKVYLPTAQLGKLSHKEYELFKDWWWVCDKIQSSILLLPYHDLGSMAPYRWWGAAEWAGVVCPGEKEVEGGLIDLCSFLKGGCSEVGIDLFSQVTNYRMRGNCLKLLQGSFRLEIRKIFLTERVVRLWNKLLREIVE